MVVVVVVCACMCVLRVSVICVQVENRYANTTRIKKKLTSNQASDMQNQVQ